MMRAIQRLIFRVATTLEQMKNMRWALIQKEASATKIPQGVISPIRMQKTNPCSVMLATRWQTLKASAPRRHQTPKAISIPNIQQKHIAAWIK